VPVLTNINVPFVSRRLRDSATLDDPRVSGGR